MGGNILEIMHGKINCTAVFAVKTFLLYVCM